MRVIVDIERSATTVSGQIMAGGVTPVEFFGWLDLIDRLDSAAGAAASRPPAPPARPGAHGTSALPVNRRDTHVV
jgi:hypothetical protein